MKMRSVTVHTPAVFCIFIRFFGVNSNPRSAIFWYFCQKTVDKNDDVR